MISGARLLYNKLLQNRVRDVFLYSGGAVMPLVDCFHNQTDISYYINSNEHNGCNAAIGYAKSSNKTGVMITTSGPGLTNCVTSILDSQNDSSPLVVISGQVSRNVMGTQAFQECPATQITESITKWSHVVRDITDLHTAIDRAFYLANTGKPGAVHLDVPNDVWLTKTLPYYPDSSVIENNRMDNSHPLGLYVKPSNSIDGRVREIITKSKRPLLFLGKGCNNYSTEIRRLVDRLEIPFTTTLHAQGVVPETHPLALEMCGMHGSYVANMALQNADCIIGIGARFDDRTTGNPTTYAPRAEHVISCNIEPGDIGQNVRADIEVVADAGVFIQELLRLPVVKRPPWIQQLEGWRTQHPFRYERSQDGSLRTPDAIRAINRCKQEGDIFTFGVGNHMMMGCQYLTWTEPKTAIASGSLGVMGASIGYAIGAQIANPDKRVISIDGDGSFNMTLTDLQTVVRYRLPIKIAIMNDGSLSMVKAWEKLFYGERYVATDNPANPDYVRLAESYGIPAIRCSNKTELDSCTQMMMDAEGPMLCEYVTKGEVCYPLVPPGEALDQMKLLCNKTKNWRTEKAH